MLSKVIPDWLISGSLNLMFSKLSLIVHTVWFILWFVLHQDVNLLTNIVSLEAIYVGILIGIQQFAHHTAIKDHIDSKGE